MTTWICMACRRGECARCSSPAACDHDPHDGKPTEAPAERDPPSTSFGTTGRPRRERARTIYDAAALPPPEPEPSVDADDDGEEEETPTERRRRLALERRRREALASRGSADAEAAGDEEPDEEPVAPPPPVEKPALRRRAPRPSPEPRLPQGVADVAAAVEATRVSVLGSPPAPKEVAPPAPDQVAERARFLHKKLPPGSPSVFVPCPRVGCGRQMRAGKHDACSRCRIGFRPDGLPPPPACATPGCGHTLRRCKDGTYDTRCRRCRDGKSPGWVEPERRVKAADVDLGSFTEGQLRKLIVDAALEVARREVAPPRPGRYVPAEPTEEDRP